MGRLTKSENDLIRNKAIAIIRNLTADQENKLTHDELSVLSSFLLIERAENTKLKKCEDEEEQPTAFNVEEVVKELENTSSEIFGHTKIISTNKAIEIVRRGGVNHA